MNRFLAPCGQAAKRSIIELAVKHALLELEADNEAADLDALALADRLAVCVLAFADADRPSVHSALDKVLPRWDTSSVDCKVRAVGRLGTLDVFWDAAPAGTREYMNALVVSVAPEDLPPTVVSLAVSDTAIQHLPNLRHRLSELPAGNLAQAIAMRPDALFVPFAPSLLRRAPSFRSAEAIFESGILPLAEWYSLSDVQAILVAWHENNQCVMAGAMPGNAAQLFEATRSLLPDSLDAWRDFLQQVRAVAGGSTYYHYPTLEGLVRDASTD